MTSPELWDFDVLPAVAVACADGDPATPITGVSIDTRTLKPGDLFVALKAERDGHAFVTDAFAKGAAAALVSTAYERKPDDGALVRADDTLVSLELMASAARSFLTPNARVIAVTGSAGKTGTKEALARCLSRSGPTHASEKSYNNHWGVPLTLARMPQATRYGVFEIGMNHAGEIRPLTKLVRPHAAIVTTVEPVHLEFFDSVEGIADAKAEIFEGLEPGGKAIVNLDNPQFERLANRARELGAEVVAFGEHPESDARLLSFVEDGDGSDIEADILGRRLSVRVGVPGKHIARNMVAVLAAVSVVGADLDAAAEELAHLKPGAGRGARTVVQVDGGAILLIDESYNANPASMRAALAGLSAVDRGDYPRRIAILGDMLELGPQAGDFHAALADAVAEGGIDLVFASGANMRRLFDALPPDNLGAYAAASDGLRDAVLREIRAGDAVVVKGSLGSRMAPLVEAFKGLVLGSHASKDGVRV